MLFRSITVQAGVTTIYARAIDLAGNSKTVRISVYVDVSRGPVVSGSSIPIRLVLVLSTGAIAAEMTLWGALRRRERRRKAGGKA